MTLCVDKDLFLFSELGGNDNLVLLEFFKDLLLLQVKDLYFDIEVEFLDFMQTSLESLLADVFRREEEVAR